MTIHERDRSIRLACHSIWDDIDAEKAWERFIDGVEQPRRGNRRLLPIVVSCALLLGLAGFLTHSLLAPRSGPQTGRPPTVYETDHIYREQALMSLVKAMPPVVPVTKTSFEDVDHGDPLVLGSLQKALDLGLLKNSDGPMLRPQDFIKRKEYALWLWRAYGELLRSQYRQGQYTAVDPYSDLLALSQEETQAVENLAGLGVLNSYADKTFRPEEDLTRRDRDLWLVRLRKLLPLDKDKIPQAEGLTDEGQPRK